MALLDLLLVGDGGHGEFRGAVEWLVAHCRLRVAATPAAALAELVVGEPPQVIVLAQSRPGQFAREDVEAVHRAAPLARLVSLCGSWCEGETRTGHPWPGVVRVYWHQFEARLADQLPRLATSVWALPRTSSDVERHLASDRVAPGSPGGRRLIAISAATVTAYAGLADACAGAGYATLWVPPRQKPRAAGAAAAIWDAPHDGEPDEVARFVRFVQPAPVMALLSFPRQADLETMQSAGVARVLAKPFLVPDLLAALQLELAVVPRRSAAA